MSEAAPSRFYLWVLLFMVLGCLIGVFSPAFAVELKPLSDWFLQLIKMMIGPLIFCSVVHGIVGVGNTSHVAKIGLKAFLYFEVISTLALTLGLLTANLLKPGVGFAGAIQSADLDQVHKMTSEGGSLSGLAHFFNLLTPKTITDAFSSSGSLVQVLFISILFGVALSRASDHAAPLIQGIESLMATLFKAFEMIMKLAPIGAGAAIGYTVGKHGLPALLPLINLLAAFYLTCFLFVFGVLLLVSIYFRFSLLKLLKLIRPEIVMVLGTSSSESALSSLIKKLERFGCKREVVGLVVPVGYSFNLDGTCIYLTLAILFIAQVYGVELTGLQQVKILGFAMLTSKGASGVTGAGFVTLAATLAVVPSVPMEGLGLILGVDRFLSEGRAVTNLIGNAVGGVVISKLTSAAQKS